MYSACLEVLQPHRHLLIPIPSIQTLITILIYVHKCTTIVPNKIHRLFRVPLEVHPIFGFSWSAPEFITLAFIASNYRTSNSSSSILFTLAAHTSVNLMYCSRLVRLTKPPSWWSGQDMTQVVPDKSVQIADQIIAQYIFRLSSLRILTALSYTSKAPPNSLTYFISSVSFCCWQAWNPRALPWTFPRNYHPFIPNEPPNTCSGVDTFLLLKMFHLTCLRSSHQVSRTSAQSPLLQKDIHSQVAAPDSYDFHQMVPIPS